MDSPPRHLVMIVTATMSMFVANLYYAQPLALFIAHDLGLPSHLSGTLISASQFGYATGLFLIVPLADAIDYRRLVLMCSSVVVVGLAGLALAPGPITFIAFGALTGIFSSGAQVLLPYLSRVLPAQERGRALGMSMAAVLTTVMLARPIALFFTAWVGWRALYALSAVISVLLAVALSRVMQPLRAPVPISFVRTIGSMFGLLVREKRVRRRTFYQAAIFASFTMFWAVTPILLAQRFGLTAPQIGLFALVGAGGALTAPVAGRLADRGLIRPVMRIALIVILVCFVGTIWAADARSIVGLVLAAVLIDGAVQATQTFGRLIVLEVHQDIRGRVNGLYMTIVYSCGALGSIGGVACYVHWGWIGVAGAGVLLVGAVLIGALTEPRDGGAAEAPIG